MGSESHVAPRRRRGGEGVRLMALPSAVEPSEEPSPTVAARVGSSPAAADHRAVEPPQPFEHLVLDFLAYLEFERGLSRNTLDAYRSDLFQFGAYLDPVEVDALEAGHAEL